MLAPTTSTAYRGRPIRYKYRAGCREPIQQCWIYQGAPTEPLHTPDFRIKDSDLWIDIIIRDAGSSLTRDQNSSLTILLFDHLISGYKIYLA